MGAYILEPVKIWCYIDQGLLGAEQQFQIKLTTNSCILIFLFTNHTINKFIDEGEDFA